MGGEVFDQFDQQVLLQQFGDEEHRVGTGDPGFPDLVGLEHEILAQGGQGDGVTRGRQEFGRTGTARDGAAERKRES